MRHRGARALSLQGRGLRDGLQVVRRRRAGSRAQPLRAGQRHGGFLCQEGPGGGGSADRVLGRVPAQEDGRSLPLQMGEFVTDDIDEGKVDYFCLDPRDESGYAAGLVKTEVQWQRLWYA